MCPRGVNGAFGKGILVCSMLTSQRFSLRRARKMVFNLFLKTTFFST